VLDAKQEAHIRQGNRRSLCGTAQSLDGFPVAAGNRSVRRSEEIGQK
jgi:hypothetical protein